jgi:hypothetical protein
MSLSKEEIINLKDICASGETGEKFINLHQNIIVRNLILELHSNRIKIQTQNKYEAIFKNLTSKY